MGKSLITSKQSPLNKFIISPPLCIFACTIGDSRATASEVIFDGLSPERKINEGKERKESAGALLQIKKHLPDTADAIIYTFIV